jgi:hypothetical protein
VRARVACELFVLDKADFLEALRDQPRVARRVWSQARAQYDLRVEPEALAKLAS